MTDTLSLQDVRSIAHLQTEVEDLRKDVADLTAATRDLVKAWEAGGTLLTFIKWVATISAALGSAWLLVRQLTGHPS